jgi:hypothetical protein
MQTIKSQLKLMACLCLFWFLAAGCCSTPCLDCIPHNKMPYMLYDKGIKYYLTDHVSIDQMIDAEELQDFISKRWPEILRSKFPNDKELMTYLDERQKKLDELHQKVESKHESHMDFLWDMEDNLEKTSGELYFYYRVSDKKDNEEEQGYLILSKGKVFKTYVTGTDIKTIKQPNTALEPTATAS